MCSIECVLYIAEALPEASQTCWTWDAIWCDLVRNGARVCAVTTLPGGLCFVPEASGRGM